MTDSDCNVDKIKGARKLKALKKNKRVIIFGENHNPSNGFRYSDHSFKCYNKGYTFEYTRAHGTIENDNGKRGYHNYKNNWVFADGAVKSLKWEDTIKPENLWLPLDS